MRTGAFSLREADRPRRPEGVPEVPTEWAPFLLQKPVAGTITEVLADHVAILSAGAKDGVKAGMEFVREIQLPVSRIRVLFTDTDRCIVRIGPPGVGALPDSRPVPFPVMMLGSQPPAVGERFSSRTADPKETF
jgi:hypothetical protein